MSLYSITNIFETKVNIKFGQKRVNKVKKYFKVYLKLKAGLTKDLVKKQLTINSDLDSNRNNNVLRIKLFQYLFSLQVFNE